MRKRYKLVRICNDKFLSANSYSFAPFYPVTLEYKVGEVTECEHQGVACYKTLKYADVKDHIDETMKTFNKGNPIAVIELEPVGKPVFRDSRYGKNQVYAGGVNYRAVKVLRVIRVIKNDKT